MIYSIQRTRNGKRSGSEEYFHINGSVRDRHEFRDGKPHGLTRQWTKDGTLTYWANFSEGQLIGVTRWWNKEGALLAELDHRNGVPPTGIDVQDHFWGAGFFGDYISGFMASTLQQLKNGVPDGTTTWYDREFEEIGTGSEKVLASCEYRAGQPYKGVVKEELGSYLHAFIEYRNGFKDGKISYFQAAFSPKHGERFLSPAARMQWPKLSKQQQKEAPKAEAVQIAEGIMKDGKKWSGTFIESLAYQSVPDRKWRIETWQDGVLQDSSETQEFLGPQRALFRRWLAEKEMEKEANKKP